MNRQIMNVLINEYDMLNHLKLLKAILLMGQGDFSHCLIELLNDELDKKRISLSLVHLRHRLHTAIALTFDDEDVARQLYSTVDVRLMTTSSDDIGWNVFSLSYRFYDIPLQMMFHEELMMKFRRIFNFLWRLKRSNFILSKHWLLHRSMKSPLERFKEFRVAAYISTIVHSSLTFFLKQVSRYIFMDIIECGWNALFRIIMEKTMDCNEFIDSIHLYLKLVCEKLNIDFHSQWQRKISSELRCIIDLINDYDQLNNRLMELNRSYAKFYQNLEKVKEKERENYDKLKEKIKTATLYRSTSPMVDAHESRSIAKRRSVTDNVGNLSLRKCVSTQNLHLDDSLPITLSQFPSHTTDQFNQSINIPNNNNRNRASTGHRASYGHVRSRYRSSSRARSQMTSSSNTPSLFQLKTMENVNIRVHIAHYISTDYEQEIFHNLQEEKKKFIQEFISLKECFIRLSSSYINHLRSSSSADITLKGLVTTLNFNNFYFNS
ncbi:hypothetical protein SNEBB_007927 [Seison nebaliae]|nr:hypothetical protein SNEBB_007927 [Seison nebaliae]